ncbi:MAG: 2'-5' RNA ligase family protein [Trueperaceae bacterium]
MAYVLELQFSPEDEVFILHLMQQLKELNLPSNLLEKNVPPHLTLFTDEFLTAIKMNKLAELLEHTKAFALMLASLGTFSNEHGVLFLAPVVQQNVLEFHKRVHACCEPSSDLGQLYTPGRWVPHITLATKYSREQLAKAVVGLEVSLPKAIHVSKLVLVDYSNLTALKHWLFND